MDKHSFFPPWNLMGEINLRKIKWVLLYLFSCCWKFCLLKCCVHITPPHILYFHANVHLCCELQTHEYTDFNRPVQFCGSSLLGGFLPSWSSWEASSRRICDILLPEHLPGHTTGKYLQVIQPITGSQMFWSKWSFYIFFCFRAGIICK